VAMSDERRQALSRRAKELHSQGRFGGSEFAKLGGRPKKVECVPPEREAEARAALEALRLWLKVEDIWRAIPYSHLCRQREESLLLFDSVVRKLTLGPEPDPVSYLSAVAHVLKESGRLKAPTQESLSQSARYVEAFGNPNKTYEPPEPELPPRRKKMNATGGFDYIELDSQELALIEERKRARVLRAQRKSEKEGRRQARLEADARKKASGSEVEATEPHPVIDDDLELQASRAFAAGAKLRHGHMYR
jgi:hypothetical protein